MPNKDKKYKDLEIYKQLDLKLINNNYNYFKKINRMTYYEISKINGVKCYKINGCKYFDGFTYYFNSWFSKDKFLREEFYKLSKKNKKKIDHLFYLNIIKHNKKVNFETTTDLQNFLKGARNYNVRNLELTDINIVLNYIDNNCKTYTIPTDKEISSFLLFKFEYNKQNPKNEPNNFIEASQNKYEFPLEKFDKCFCIIMKNLLTYILNRNCYKPILDIRDYVIITDMIDNKNIKNINNHIINFNKNTQTQTKIKQKCNADIIDNKNTQTKIKQKCNADIIFKILLNKKT